MTAQHALIAAAIALTPPTLHVAGLWVAHWADTRHGWYQR